MARLSKGAETTISMAFLVMCAEKIRRLLHLIFVTIFVWLCALQSPRSLCMWFGNIWHLESANSLVAV
jgi:transposase, IS5 family